jgi:putative component of membrane protein insertase Oxa1/YidC/SpoIIIJ protein YidD
METVERYGALRGGWMAAGRVLRCHPFVKGGYDPVVKDQRCGGPSLRHIDHSCKVTPRARAG